MNALTNIDLPETPPTIGPSELQQWLEWAGSKMLSLQVRGTKPSGYRSFWPDYEQDKATAYGYTSERLRPALPSGHDISLMDEILLLPNLISDPTIRRIVHARSLVTPVGNRYLYTWVKIAKLLHTDRRAIARLHGQGLSEIHRKLDPSKRDALRQTFITLWH